MTSTTGGTVERQILNIGNAGVTLSNRARFHVLNRRSERLNSRRVTSLVDLCVICVAATYGNQYADCRCAVPVFECRGRRCNSVA